MRLATDLLGLLSFSGDVARLALGAGLALTAGDLLPDFFLFLQIQNKSVQDELC